VSCEDPRTRACLVFACGRPGTVPSCQPIDQHGATSRTSINQQSHAGVAVSRRCTPSDVAKLAITTQAASTFHLSVSPLIAHTLIDTLPSPARTCRHNLLLLRTFPARVCTRTYTRIAQSLCACIHVQYERTCAHTIARKAGPTSPTPSRAARQPHTPSPLVVFVARRCSCTSTASTLRGILRQRQRLNSTAGL
jgi:hypothetical protein